MTKSILLVGVGGQGTILAAKILTTGLMNAGYDVKMSEIHGMSQRGGSVSSHVRFGESVESPVIEIGSADLLVAFEKLEAYRWMEYLNPSGNIIVNDLEISPVSVLSGKCDYPKDLVDSMKEKIETLVLDATTVATDMGNTKVMNIILLGAIVKIMNLEDIDWYSIIEDNVKEKFIDINKKAFDKGKTLVN